MADFEQTNVNLTVEDVQMLTMMMRESGYDNRSAFVRWLIRQEWSRRSRATPPVVSVAGAVASGNEVENGTI